MVTVPRAELDALRAEVRRLRREVGRSVARARMEGDPGPGDACIVHGELAGTAPASRRRLAPRGAQRLMHF
jgi:hypothetical protein